MRNLKNPIPHYRTMPSELGMQVHCVGRQRGGQCHGKMGTPYIKMGTPVLKMRV